MTPATRELLAERYHLEERLATGGMGVVWRARDERLDRDVAIKLIRPEYADDPTFRQRLRLEARAIAAIRDPHVVRIHDVCEEKDPTGGYRSFLVMELIDGAPLSAVVRDGTLPVGLTVEVIRQAAAALAAAHDQQIVHRDIKPANLMLDAAGRVTVLDFGIARAADAVALTATDLILGTARYISPEQADGRGATAASDVYSLGVVAFQCLAGRVPFDAGSDVGVALAHLRDPIPPLPPNVPPAVADLVTRMLAKAAGERPTARAVADELSAMAGETEPLTSEITAPIPQRRQELKQAATAVLPAVLAAQHRVRDRLAGRDLTDTRSASMRPRMAFVAAAVAAVLLAIPMVFGGGDDGLHAAAAADATTALTAAHHVQTTPQVAINAPTYLGKPWVEVRKKLRALGLKPVPQFTGTGDHSTVVALAPTGKVDTGTTISVLVSRTGADTSAEHPAPAHHDPKPQPKAKPPAKHGPGGHVPPGKAKKDGGPGPH